MFDTKRRLTQKLTNSLADKGASDLLGQEDDDHKTTKKNEIAELKKLLQRMCASIKSLLGSMGSFADNSGLLSASMMELATERRENSSKGYLHAAVFQEASSSTEAAARSAMDTLSDAHESLVRKISDFKTIEKQVRAAHANALF